MLNDEKLALSVREVSSLLGLGRTSVYDAVRTGELPSIRIGTRILIPKAGIDALLKATASVPNGAVIAEDG